MLFAKMIADTFLDSFCSSTPPCLTFVNDETHQHRDLFNRMEIVFNLLFNINFLPPICQFTLIFTSNLISLMLWSKSLKGNLHPSLTCFIVSFFKNLSTILNCLQVAHLQMAHLNVFMNDHFTCFRLFEKVLFEACCNSFWRFYSVPACVVYNPEKATVTHSKAKF
jgi:hypothetical protein